MKYIAVLITVHNRKAKTLQCLSYLFSLQVVNGYLFEVYLTDDGCTDGTPEAVATQYPSVQIVKGDGALFWNRGMYRAWQVAAQNKDYDFYLWLNDDTILYPNALETLIQTSIQKQHKAIIVGSTTDSEHLSLVTYGGRSQAGKLITPTNEAQMCSFFNGNIVLIPKYVFDIVGFNDPTFHHSLGDFDYGLRAVKKGIKIYITPGIAGKCDTHKRLATWCNPVQPFQKRWKAFRSPLGQNPEEFFIFEKRHNGLLVAIFHYFTNHLRVLIPHLWVNNK